MYSDEKANNFIDRIKKNSELECHQILSKIEDNKAQMLLSAEREALTASTELITREKASIHKEIASQTVRVEEELTRKLLNRRSEIVDSVFEKARKKLIDFTRDDEYTVFLSCSARKINEYCPDEKCTVYMKKEDCKHESIITEIIKNCTLEYTDDITIGGIRVNYPEKNMIFDSTLDSGLEQEIEDFSFTSDLSVSL